MKNHNTQALCPTLQNLVLNFTSHDYFPAICKHLLGCIAHSFGVRRKDRDRFLWYYDRISDQPQNKEVANFRLHLQANGHRRVPRLLNRSDGPYRDQQAYHEPWPISAFLSPTKASELVVSLANTLLILANEAQSIDIGEVMASTNAMLLGDRKEQKAKLGPDEVILSVVLFSTQALFECRTTLPERTFENMFQSGKKLLKRTQIKPNVRSVTLSSLRL